MYKKCTFYKKAQPNHTCIWINEIFCCICQTYICTKIIYFCCQNLLSMHSLNSWASCQTLLSLVSTQKNYFWCLILYDGPSQIRIYCRYHLLRLLSFPRNGAITNSLGTRWNTEDWRKSTSHRSTFGFQTLFFTISKTKEQKTLRRLK